MLKGARFGREIVVSVVNKIGVLADASRALAEHGINIEAVAGYAKEDNTAKIMFVTADTLRTVDALKKAGYNSINENEVVIVELEDKPGALKFVTAKLAAEEIDIKHIYGTTCATGCPARIVFSSSNNQKALAAFRK